MLCYSILNSVRYYYAMLYGLSRLSHVMSYCFCSAMLYDDILKCITLCYNMHSEITTSYTSQHYVTWGYILSYDAVYLVLYGFVHV